MTEVKPVQFAEFFEALHGHPPFPWQERLAQTVCAGEWPQVIDLPTASGKTACLDIALFALAATGKAARRIFFVVDRRVIVNEAFQRMKKVADTLSAATTGILAAAADSLRNLAGPNSASPLSVYQLRGGIYRDQSWLRSPLQPMIVTSTVDQVGSRILFRGYGVSDSSAPIHAALIANDSLIFLDEAHCSKAFSQTLGSIRTYRSDAWARTPLKKAFSFVEMTATPSQEVNLPFKLEVKDYENEFLKLRLFAAKPTTLPPPVKARANDREALPKSLAHQAIAMASDSGAKRIAVMVNRVATARRVFGLLGEQIPAQNLHLLIGRMRPIDRDKLVERLDPLKAGSKRDTQINPIFVVSTQCLEVGADLDFDVLVTECASIDALLQRFGRLDRLGSLSGRARGCILTTSAIADAKDPDPIYGHCLAETWRWLNSLPQNSNTLNMGIESADLNNPTVAQLLKLLPKEESAKMRRMGADAPALLPSHVDAFAQTSPRPYADPDVALFLHGRQDGPAEIQVVWRKDLDDVPVDSWKEIVALCPPVSAEAMPVRLSQFRAWLTRETISTSIDSDLEGIGSEDDDSQQEQTRFQEALIWRGDNSCVAGKPADIKPNDTVILSLIQRGWEDLGHIPEPVKDVAEEAIRQARSRTVFRVHSKLWPSPTQLDKLLENEEFDWELWQELVNTNRDFLELNGVASANHRDFKPPVPYPSKPGAPPPGWILQPKKKSQSAQAGRIQMPLGEDDGNDETSVAASPINLEDHTRDVKEAVQTLALKLLPDFSETLSCAAYLHDSGKADPRFQVMLHGGDHMAAAFEPAILAKGAMLTNGLFQTAKKKSELPDHFRHELVSLQFAAKHCSDRTDRDLIMHLIASHHGYCRPFAPRVLDTDPRDTEWNGLAITTEERLALPAHQMSSGVVRRFWQSTRDFGWWGTAYLEACLRLADWTASEFEQKASDAK